VRNRNKIVCCLSTALLAAVVPALAQDAPIIRKGVTEVGGFVGASYGIDQARVMGGGNVVYSLTRPLMPFAEFSYFPGIGRSRNVPGIAGAKESFSIPITDFNFGLHLRVPIPKSRVIPYAVISVGGIHSPQRTVVAEYPDPFNPSRKVQDNFTALASTDFAVSGGGGIRLYATERLGFRGEFKAYKPTGTFTNPFYRATGGFFFQF
jgi:hypothetical protein